MYKKLNENCEFFFGKGVGGKIYDAINDAHYSVFVFTPYLSAGYVDFLLRKQQEEVDVALVTSSEVQNGKLNEICKKIILQHRITDEKKQAIKKKVKRGCFLLGLVAFLSVLVNFFWYHAHSRFPSMMDELGWFWFDESVFVSGMSGLLLFSILSYKLFHRIKIFSYFYSTKFPFTILPSPYSEHAEMVTSVQGSFPHAKIYIVDNREIFIGSANFTQSGLRHNIESFVKISSPDTVNDIIMEINDYIEKHCLPANINRLGSRLYYEPAY